MSSSKENPTAAGGSSSDHSNLLQDEQSTAPSSSTPSGDTGAARANIPQASHTLHLGEGLQPAALIGSSNAVIALRAAINEVASARPVTALIVGATGVGRRQVASAIHRESGHADSALRYIDCHESSPMELDALLGVGGVSDRLEPTNKDAAGTAGLLVIDGAQCLAASSQARLVDYIEQLNANATNAAAYDSVVLIVNQGIAAALDSGQLNQALYDVLADQMVVVPELSERGQDVLDIARHFVQSLNADIGDSKQLSDELEYRLTGYHWPGNVQELKFIIHELYRRAGSAARIEVDQTVAPMLLSDQQRAIRDTVGTSFWELQKLLLLETLLSVGGDKQRAAETLGISLKTLYNRLRDYR